jgi:hypothetical protein
MEAHSRLGVAVFRGVRRVVSSLAVLSLAAMGLGVAAAGGCQVHRAAVRLSMERVASTPRDASVYIDEQFVGFLGVVAVRGVRLPEGEHRITVEKVGFFPWDQLVVSDRKPVHLKVELRQIPD